MLASIFTFIESILGIAGADPEAQGIVAQVFEAIISFLGV